MNKKSNPLLIFYILTIYIVLQFAWWTYMLSNLNDEVYAKKTELVFSSQKTILEKNDLIDELEKKLIKKKLMIIGEGSVFILLLLAGIYKTRKSFFKELKLAEQQKNFLLSITHELKSPVASVKLYLQTLLKRDLEKQKIEQILINSIKETERLNNLIDNLLVASKIESELYPIFLEKTLIRLFIEKTVINLKTIYQDKYEIVININPELSLDIDKQAFSSIILNLLENAIKYSPINTTISIESHQENGRSILRIIDQGIGIPDHEKKLIFNRFYRIGSEETRSAKGTGLGLFIVKHLIEKQKGEIAIYDNTPKGSIFEIIF